MRGRKPKPTFLRLVEGNPGKRAINHDEPQPPGNLSEPPAHLTAAQRRIWLETLAHVPEGLLRKLDGPAFEAWVIETVRYRDAEAKIQTMGMLVRGVDGRPIRNPYLAIARDAQQAAAKLAVELGFTPSSRSRVKIERPKKAANPFGKLRSLGDEI